MTTTNSYTLTPPPPRPSSAPLGTPTHVSESSFEFLLTEILHWVESECQLQQQISKTQQTKHQQDNVPATESDKPVSAENELARKEEEAILIAEQAAAKMERMGFDVGYRLVERLAQNKVIGPPLGAASGGNSVPKPAMVQLEAVKFLCKEFWTEVFRKQIDKLQTNHRGVFVLRDHEFKWLKRLPSEDETARVTAIKMLAFPCGLIRGALMNLGISAVVSCDFLADGKNMAACSFNIKIKI